MRLNRVKNSQAGWLASIPFQDWSIKVSSRGVKQRGHSFYAAASGCVDGLGPNAKGESEPDAGFCVIGRGDGAGIGIGKRYEVDCPMDISIVAIGIISWPSHRQRLESCAKTHPIHHWQGEQKLLSMRAMRMD